MKTISCHRFLYLVSTFSLKIFFVCKLKCLFSENITYTFYYNDLFNSGSEILTKNTIVSSRNAIKLLIKDQFLNCLNSELFNITHSIESISITNCNATQISTFFLYNQTTDGTTLKISQNNIRILKSHTFEKLLIEGLDLSENKIEVVQNKVFCDLPKLHVIFLAYNSLTSINSNSYLNIPSLKEIYFHFNFIVELQENLFEYFSENLTDIQITKNQIKSIDKNLFRNFKAKNIKCDLQINLIEKIPENLFADLSFSRIDLSDNRLTTLPDDFFYGNFTVVFFRISCNQLTLAAQERLTKWAKDSGIILECVYVENKISKIYNVNLLFVFIEVILQYYLFH